MLLKPHKREQILPLPVVLISTVSVDGVRNIAVFLEVRISIKHKENAGN
ncbi:hypothetical protein [Desulfoscipio gibsoniae]|nr:hypothetical protein [Desulfoscipio gibsoniae]